MQSRKAFYVEIGGRIKAARRATGIGQKALAALLSVSRATVANIETGRHAIKVFELGQVAEILHVSIVSLLPPSTISSFTGTVPDVLESSDRDWFLKVLRGDES